MNGRTSTVRVFGSSLTADPFAPQHRPYVYGGTDRLQPVEPVEQVEKQPARAGKGCLVDGCEKPHHAKGYCAHHRQKVRAGKPLDQDNRRRPFDPSKCGTVAGYARHCHHDVPVCDPCRDAKNTYDRARHAEKRSAA